MSELLDERVVEMRFDNADFERNVDQSIKTINKLKESLDFEDAGSSLDDLSSAAARVDLSPVEDSVDEIAVKFNVLDMVAANVLSNIVNKAVDAGTRMAKSVSVDQITAGWSKYEQKTSAVQTIIAATGESIDYVNSKLEKLIWFADETSYDFVDMVNNIGKFTSAGIDLDTAVNSMMGISNWAAVSGAGIQQASRAMYNLSQSIGMGYVAVQDWKSIEIANMATEEFKQTAIAVALAKGELKEVNGQITTLDGKVEVTAETMRETLKKKWFTSDVLNETLGIYSEFANVVREVQEAYGIDTVSETIKFMENNNEFAEIMDSLGAKAFKAAQEAKTFTEAINATKDAVSSGWMKTFELIFGNYQEAKKLWTGLANDLWDIFAYPGELRNNMLYDVMTSNYRKMLDDMPDGQEFNTILYNKIYEAAKQNRGEKLAEAMFKEFDSLEDIFKKSAVFSSEIKAAFGAVKDDNAAELKKLKALEKSFTDKNTSLKQIAIRLASGYYGKEEEAARKAMEKEGLNYDDFINYAQAYNNGIELNWEAEQKSYEDYLNERISMLEQFNKKIDELSLKDTFFDELLELGGRDKLIGGFQNIMSFFKNLYVLIIKIADGFGSLFGSGSLLSLLIDGFYNLTGILGIAGDTFYGLQNVVDGLFHESIPALWDQFLHGYDVTRTIKEVGSEVDEMGNIIDNVSKSITSETEHIPGLIDRITSAYEEHIKTLPQEVQNTINTITGTVTQFFGSIPQKIEELKTHILGKAREVSVVNLDTGESYSKIIREGGLINDLQNKFETFAGGLLPNLLNGVSTILEKISKYLFGYEENGKKINGHAQVIIDKVTAFVNFLKDIGKHVKDIFITVFEDVMTFFTGGKYSFSDAVIWSLPDRLKKKFDDLTKSKAWNTVVDFLFGKKNKPVQVFGDNPNDVWIEYEREGGAIQSVYDSIKKVRDFIFGVGKEGDANYIPNIIDNIKSKIAVLASSTAVTKIKEFIFGNGKEGKDHIPNLFERIGILIDKIGQNPAFIAIKEFIFGNGKEGKDHVPNLFERINILIDKIGQNPAFIAIKEFIFGNGKEGKDHVPNLFERINMLIDKIGQNPAFIAIKEFIFGNGKEGKDHIPNLFERIGILIDKIGQNPAFIAIKEFIFGNGKEGDDHAPNLFERISGIIKGIGDSDAFKAVYAFVFGAGKEGDENYIPNIFTRISDLIARIGEMTAFKAVRDFIFGNGKEGDDHIPNLLERIRGGFDAIWDSAAFKAIRKFFTGEEDLSAPEEAVETLHKASDNGKAGNFLASYSAPNLNALPIVKDDQGNIIQSKKAKGIIGFIQTLQEKIDAIGKSKAFKDVKTFFSGSDEKHPVYGPNLEIDHYEQDIPNLFVRIRNKIEKIWKPVKEFLFGSKTKINGVTVPVMGAIDHIQSKLTRLWQFIKPHLDTIKNSLHEFRRTLGLDWEIQDGKLTRIPGFIDKISEKLKTIKNTDWFGKITDFFLGKKIGSSWEKDEITGKYYEKIIRERSGLLQFGDKIADFVLGPINEEGKRTGNIFERFPEIMKNASSSLEEFFIGKKKLVKKEGPKTKLGNEFFYYDYEREGGLINKLKEKFEQLKSEHQWFATFCSFIETQIQNIGNIFKNAGGDISLALGNLNAYLNGGKLKHKNELGEIVEDLEPVPGLITDIRTNIEKIFNGGKEKEDKSFLDQIVDILGGRRPGALDSIRNFINTLTSLNIFMLSASFKSGSWFGFEIQSGLSALIDTFKDLALTVAILAGTLVSLTFYFNWLKTKGYSSLLYGAATITAIGVGVFLLSKALDGVKVNAFTAFSLVVLSGLIGAISIMVTLMTALVFGITALLAKFNVLDKYKSELITAGAILGGVLTFIAIISASSVKVVGKDQKIKSTAGIWFGIAAALFGLSSFLITIAGLLAAIYLFTRNMSKEQLTELKRAGKILAGVIVAALSIATIISLVGLGTKNQSNAAAFAVIASLLYFVNKLIVTLFTTLIGIYAFMKGKSAKDLLAPMGVLITILAAIVGLIAAMSFLIGKIGSKKTASPSDKDNKDKEDKIGSLIDFLVKISLITSRLVTSIALISSLAKITGWENVAVAFAGLAILLTTISGSVMMLSKTEKIDAKTLFSVVFLLTSVLITFSLLAAAIALLISNNDLENIGDELVPLMGVFGGVIALLAAIYGIYTVINKFIIKDNSFADIEKNIGIFSLVLTEFLLVLTLVGGAALLYIRLYREFLADWPAAELGPLDPQNIWKEIAPLFAVIGEIMAMMGLFAGAMKLLFKFTDISKKGFGNYSADVLKFLGVLVEFYGILGFLGVLAQEYIKSFRKFIAEWPASELGPLNPKDIWKELLPLFAVIGELMAMISLLSGAMALLFKFIINGQGFGQYQKNIGIFILTLIELFAVIFGMADIAFLFIRLYREHLAKWPSEELGSLSAENLWKELLPLFAVIGEMMALMIPLAALMSLYGHLKFNLGNAAGFAVAVVTLIAALPALAWVAKIFIEGYRKFIAEWPEADLGKLDSNNLWKELLPLFAIIGELMVLMVPLAGILAIVGKFKMDLPSIGSFATSLLLMTFALMLLGILAVAISDAFYGIKEADPKRFSQLQTLWKDVLPILAVIAEFEVLMLPLVGMMALMSHFKVDLKQLDGLPKLLFTFAGIIVIFAAVAAALTWMNSVMPNSQDLKWNSLLPQIVVIAGLVGVLGLIMAMIMGISAVMKKWKNTIPDKQDTDNLFDLLKTAIKVLLIVVSAFGLIGAGLYALEKHVAHGAIREYAINGINLIGDILLSLWKCAIAIGAALVLVAAISLFVAKYPLAASVSTGKIINIIVKSLLVIGAIISGFFVIGAILMGFNTLTHDWLISSIEFFCDLIDKIGMTIVKFGIALGVVAFVLSVFEKLKIFTSAGSAISTASFGAIIGFIIKAAVVIEAILLAMSIMGGIIGGTDWVLNKIFGKSDLLEKGIEKFCNIIGNIISKIRGNKKEDPKEAKSITEKITEFVPVLESFLKAIKNLSLSDLTQVGVLTAIMGGIFASELFSKGAAWVASWQTTRDIGFVITEMSGLFGEGGPLTSLLTSIRQLSFQDVGQITLLGIIMGGIFASELFSKGAQWIASWETTKDIEYVLDDFSGIFGTGSKFENFLNAIKDLGADEIEHVQTLSSIMFSLCTSELFQQAAGWIATWGDGARFDKVLEDLNSLFANKQNSLTALLGNLDGMSESGSVDDTEAFSKIMFALMGSEFFKQAAGLIGMWKIGTSFDQILKDLSSLFTDEAPLKTFLGNIKNISNDGSVTDVEAFTGIMFALMSSEFFKQITALIGNWNIGEKSFTDILGELNTLFTGEVSLGTFLGNVESLFNGNSGNSVDDVAAFTAIMFNLMGSEFFKQITSLIGNWNMGGKSFETVLSELDTLFTGDAPLNKFLGNIEGLSSDDSTAESDIGALSNILWKVFSSTLATKGAEWVSTWNTKGPKDGLKEPLENLTDLVKEGSPLRTFITALDNSCLDESQAKKAQIIPKILTAIIGTQFFTAIEKITSWLSGDDGELNYVTQVFDKLTRPNGVIDGVVSFAMKVNEIEKGGEVSFDGVGKAAEAISSVFELLKIIGNISGVKESSEWWDKFTELFTGKKIDLSVVSTAVKGITDTLLPEMASFQKGLTTEGIDADLIKNTLGVYVDLIKTIMELGTIQGTGLDFTQFQNIGQYVIEGLANSLVDSDNKIHNAAVELGKTIYWGLMEGTESASPSKASYRVGRFVAIGLINGLDDSGKLTWAMAEKFGENTIKSIEEGIAHQGKYSEHAFNMVTEDLLDENRFNMQDFIDEATGDINFDDMRDFLHREFDEFLGADMIDGFVYSWKKEIESLPKEINDKEYADLMTSIAAGDFGLGENEIMANLIKQFEDEENALEKAERAWADYNDILEGNLSINKDLLKQKKENPPMTYEQYMEMMKHEQEGLDLLNKGKFDELAAKNGTTREEEMIKAGYNPSRTQADIDRMYMSTQAFQEFWKQYIAAKELEAEEDRLLREQQAKTEKAISTVESDNNPFKETNPKKEQHYTAYYNKANWQVSEAGNTLTETVEETAETVEQTVTDAKDEVEEAVEAAGNGTAEAMENAGTEVAEAADNAGAGASTAIGDTSEKITEEAKKFRAEVQESYKDLSGEGLNDIFGKIMSGDFDKLTDADKKMLSDLNQATVTKGLLGNGEQNRKHALSLLGVMDEYLKLAYDIANLGDFEGKLPEIASNPDYYKEAADNTKKAADNAKEMERAYDNLDETSRGVWDWFQSGIDKMVNDGADSIKLNTSNLAGLFGDFGGTFVDALKGTTEIEIPIEKFGWVYEENGKTYPVKTLADVKKMAKGSLPEGFSNQLASSFMEGLFSGEDISITGNIENWNNFSAEEKALKVGQGLSKLLANSNEQSGNILSTVMEIGKWIFNIKDATEDITNNPTEFNAEYSDLQYADALLQQVLDKYKLTKEEEGIAIQGYKSLTSGDFITSKQEEMLIKAWRGMTTGSYGSIDDAIKYWASLGLDFETLNTYFQGGHFMATDKVTDALKYAEKVQAEYQYGADYTIKDLIHDIDKGLYGEGLARKKALESMNIDYKRAQGLYDEWTQKGDAVFDRSDVTDDYAKLTDAELEALKAQERYNNALESTPEGAFKSIGEFLNGLNTAVADPATAANFTQMMNSIVDCLKGVTLENAPAFDQIGSFLRTVKTIPQDSSGIIQNVQTLVTGLQEALNGVTFKDDQFKAVTEFLSNLNNAAESVSDTLGPFTKFLTDLITLSETDVKKQAADNATAMVEAIVEVFENNYVRFSKIGKDIVDKIIEGLRSKRGDLINESFSLASGIMSVFKQGAIDKASKLGTDFVNELVGGLTDPQNADVVQNALDVLFGDKDAYKEFDEPLDAFGKPIFESHNEDLDTDYQYQFSDQDTQNHLGSKYAQQFITDFSSSLKDFSANGQLTAAMSTISEAVPDLFGSIGDTSAKGSMMFSNLAKGLQSGYDKYAPDMEAVASEVRGIFTAMVPNGYSMGLNFMANLAQGLADGMAKYGGIAFTAGFNLVENSNEGGEAAGEINSPSKVFMRFGRYIGQGLVIGINEEQKNAYDAGADLGEAALEGSKDRLGIHSPSTEMADEVGKPAVFGLVNGVYRWIDAVELAGTELGGSLLNSAGDAFNKNVGFIDVTIESFKDQVVSGFRDAINHVKPLSKEHADALQDLYADIMNGNYGVAGVNGDRNAKLLEDGWDITWEDFEDHIRNKKLDLSDLIEGIDEIDEAKEEIDELGDSVDDIPETELPEQDPKANYLDNLMAAVKVMRDGTKEAKMTAEQAQIVYDIYGQILNGDFGVADLGERTKNLLKMPGSYGVGPTWEDFKNHMKNGVFDISDLVEDSEKYVEAAKTIEVNTESVEAVVRAIYDGKFSTKDKGRDKLLEALHLPVDFINDAVAALDRLGSNMDWDAWEEYYDYYFDEAGNLVDPIQNFSEQLEEATSETEGTDTMLQKFWDTVNENFDESIQDTDGIFDAVDKFWELVNQVVDEQIEPNLNTDITITPVFDLDSVDDIKNYIEAELSKALAIDANSKITEEKNGGNEGGSESGGGSVFTFNQTNISPEPLNHVEALRKGKTIFSQLKIDGRFQAKTRP